MTRQFLTRRTARGVGNRRSVVALGRAPTTARVILIPLVLVALQIAAPAAPLVDFDFTRASVVAEWRAQNHISAMQSTPEGLEVILAGNDPYFAGPARNYPPGTNLWVHVRLKSEQGGSAQLFYFRDHPTEEKSVRFHVYPGEWREVRLRLPALGAGYRFRFDPPGSGGKCVLASLRFTAATSWAWPAWSKPVEPATPPGSPSLQAGSLTFAHAANDFASFEVRAAGKRMAIGHNRPMIGYLAGDRLRWISVNELPGRRAYVNPEPGVLRTGVHFEDPDGGRWMWVLNYEVNRETTNGIQVHAWIQVDRDRSVVFLPMLNLLPGFGSFGTNKHQGLFAGLEYLGNEPSRSEADVRGRAANRLVPDTLKITFPLMAIQAEDRYLGLIWDQQPHCAALFDSPDRTFGGGAHALGVIFPGADASIREDGSLLPQDGVKLAANKPVEFRATLIGGAGQSVVPAIQQYVELRRLPPLPTTLPQADYVKLAAAGWLDSKAREGNKYRHAVWQGFGAQPAADPAFYMDWLAAQGVEAPLAQRLGEAAREALAQVSPPAWSATLVSHVRLQVAPLVYGHVLENVAAARNSARSLLGRFQPDGTIPYRKSPNAADYGSTHFAPDANGLTGQVVESLLKAAVLAGDRELIDEALKKLRALDKFRHDVPRGAQTWEVPLHTPDILASGHLVDAYVLGYELTGEADFLAQAQYWAWTGVPFIYLRNPTDQPLGPYLTPPVYGATSWVAPVWMGLPVQWCGLVYAEALYRLARHDAAGPWKQLADGITIGGVQVTWPHSDAERQGLLPDVFHLRDQFRDGPAINPGTVQACAVRYYSGNPLYDFRVVREYGLLIHAPGEISAPAVRPGAIEFTVRAWPKQTAYVLVNRLKETSIASIKVQGKNIAPPSRSGSEPLVLEVQGTAKIQLDLK